MSSLVFSACGFVLVGFKKIIIIIKIITELTVVSSSCLSLIHI